MNKAWASETSADRHTPQAGNEFVEGCDFSANRACTTRRGVKWLRKTGLDRRGLRGGQARRHGMRRARTVWKARGSGSRRSSLGLLSDFLRSEAGRGLWQLWRSYLGDYRYRTAVRGGEAAVSDEVSM